MPPRSWRPRTLRPRLLGTLAPVAAACTRLTGLATDADPDWHSSATIYLRGAAIQGETAGGAEVNVGFDNRRSAREFGADDALDYINFSGPLLAGTWRF